VPDVVLFDFFGTLVRYEADRTALQYPTSHGLLRRWGWRRSHDDFVALWDEASQAVDHRMATSHEEASMVDYATAFSQHAEADLSDERCRELAATFVAEWSRHVCPIDGAPELIRELALSHRLGIVSNTNDTEMVPRLVALHFPPARFEHTVLSVEHGFRKPHPSIYEAALDLFGTDASRTVFVGDSYEADYQGPTDAGLRAFLIDPASRHPVPPPRRLTSVLDLPTRL
jgi:putative hydrolase of the HAD superfamily